MQSTETFVRQRGCAPKTFNRLARAVMIGLAGLAVTALPASAFVGGTYSVLQQQLKQNSSITEVVVVRRGGVARRTTVVGPRGGVASRTVVRRGAVVRGGGVARGGAVVRRGAVVRTGAWVRPARYYWPVGGAIAAGAAIGFVTAATAAAWAGAPPAPGYCWYYTDPGRTQGFWDACPQ
jgi:hypothetical protein